jgi:CarD family transcriptional regulator
MKASAASAASTRGATPTSGAPKVAASKPSTKASHPSESSKTGHHTGNRGDRAPDAQPSSAPKPSKPVAETKAAAVSKPRAGEPQGRPAAKAASAKPAAASAVASKSAAEPPAAREEVTTEEASVPGNPPRLPESATATMAPAAGAPAAGAPAAGSLATPELAAEKQSHGEPEAEDEEDASPPERVVVPRPPAKAEKFAEGDHVVYPTHGVGKVDRIAIEEIAGHRLELIHITFEENRMTLRVPVAKARSAGLRKLATRKMFDEALAVLRGRARVKRTMWSRRAQEYEAKINSGDPLAIAEVVRDLHRNAGQPDQSFSERQIYEAAMDRLAAELAALDNTDKTTAATKLAEFLKTV